MATVLPLDDGPLATSERTQLLIATWLSPAFPVGAFSYSHGLETAIAEGRVANAAGLADWIGALVER